MPSIASHPRVASARAWILAHKAVSALVAVALLSGVYGMTKAAGATSAAGYVLGTVSTGDIIVTVSGSGQVAARNDVDVAAKASGAITGVNVKVGDSVAAGQQLASIDPGDAGLQLKQAQLSYNELLASKAASNQQAGNGVTSSQQGLQSAYTTARTAVLSQDASLTTALINVQNLLANGGYLSSANASAFAAPQRSAAVAGAQQAAADLRAFSVASAGVTASSDAAALQAALSAGETAAASVAQAAKDAQSELDQIRQQTNNQNNSPDATSAYSTVTSALSSANSALSSLQSAGQGITSAQNGLSQSQTSAANTSAQSSDVLSAQLNVESKQQAYDDFFVTAPFAGVVAKLDAQLGDTVSSGTTVATVLTKDKIAAITLNEVDAAKVKVGQKATLTFDAIDGLTLTGTVAEVDLVGTVTQGVVSYGAKISLDVDDPRITSGMTVNADIIVDSAQNVLVVPSAAITTANGVSTVRVVPSSPAAASSTSVAAADVVPQTVEVTTGLSDDTNTEITSGLTEGETIVTRTQSTTAKTTAASATTRATSAARPANAGFGGGKAVRIGG